MTVPKRKPKANDIKKLPELIETCMECESNVTCIQTIQRIITYNVVQKIDN